MSRHEKKNMPLEAVSVADEYAELAIPASQSTDTSELATPTSVPNLSTGQHRVNAAFEADLARLTKGIDELGGVVDGLEASIGYLETSVPQLDSSTQHPENDKTPARFDNEIRSPSESNSDTAPPLRLPAHEVLNEPEQRLERLSVMLTDLSGRLGEIERRLDLLEARAEQSQPAAGDLFLQELASLSEHSSESSEALPPTDTGSMSPGNTWWRLNPDRLEELPLTVDSPNYRHWTTRRSANSGHVPTTKTETRERHRQQTLPVADSHDYSALTIPNPQRTSHTVEQTSRPLPVAQADHAQPNRSRDENPDEAWQLPEELQEGVERIATELDELRQDAVRIGGRLKGLANAIGSFFGEIFDEVKEQFASKPKPPIRTRAPSTWETDLQSFFDSRESVRLVDTDGNGFFEAAELRYALANEELKGSDAAVVSQLLERYEMLIQLSNDEWFTEDSGITVADLQAVHSGESRVLRENLSYWYKDLVQRWNDKPNTLFGTEERITIDAFEQDGVGDCYLLAVAGSLATVRPEALREMFSVNEDGTVRVNVKGGFRGRFDVEMPQDGEILTYARVSKKHGIWPQVLERAVGRYRRKIARFGIFGTETHHSVDDGGSLKDVIQLLTGHKAVFDYLKTSSASDIEKTMADAINDSRVTTLSTGKAVEGRETVEGTSLLYSHAYSVIGYDRQSRLFTIVDPNKNMSVRPEGGDGYMRLNAEQIKELFSWSAIETNEDIFWSVFSV